MRNEKEMFQLILDFARNDERIRAVILNGSRANPKAKKDIFQDYDIIYFVKELESFTANHRWIDVFGERIILQMPEQMMLPDYEENSRNSFSYLMIFEDKNRIDLTLFPISQINKLKPDSLTILLFDKDNLFPNLAPPDEADYLIRKPTEKEFLDVCNEFWWVSTYVAKGLWRGEITYAKDMLETIVRKMFMLIIKWQIGVETDFSVNFGKSGKNLKQLVDTETYTKILATYPNADSENIWKSLFLMTEIFEEAAQKISLRLDFHYEEAESFKVRKYLKEVKSLA